MYVKYELVFFLAVLWDICVDCSSCLQEGINYFWMFRQCFGRPWREEWCG